MRADALFRFDTHFEVFRPVNVVDTQGEVTTSYEFLKSDSGMFISSTSGGFQLATRDGITLYHQVRSVVDRNGVPALSSNGADFPMFVTAATAQFDAYGSIIGWRHTLSRELPRIIDIMAVLEQ